MDVFFSEYYEKTIFTIVISDNDVNRSFIIFTLLENNTYYINFKRLTTL